MKTVIFIILSFLSVRGIAQTKTQDNSPVFQTIQLNQSDFSAMKMTTDERSLSKLDLSDEFSNVGSISINLKVFLKNKPKLFEIQLLSDTYTEPILMKQDDHANPSDDTIYFMPVELVHTHDQLQLVVNGSPLNIDSVIVIVLGFPILTEPVLKSSKLLSVEFSESSNCNCTLPGYVNRSGWGSTQGAWGTTATTPTHLVVHHEAPGGPSPNTSSNWANRVYGIWNYHVNTLGWSDIGYNWLIDPNGVIYEGRYSSSFADPQGAHWACNSGSMSVCMLGDYSSTTITAQAKASLEELFAWKACQESIDPLGSSYNVGQMFTLNNICGHLDGVCSNTVCPGAGLYGQLSAIRSGVQSELNACSSGNACDVPTAPHTDNITETSAKLDWSPPTGVDFFESQWREVGSSIWNNESSSGSYENLNSLMCNTIYEWRVRTVCSNGIVSLWSPIETFTTSPCTQPGCNIPNGPNTNNITETTAQLNWSPSSGAISYELQWRESGTSVWSNINSSNTFENISGLICNTSYEWQVRTACSGGLTSAWSSIEIFTTNSCNGTGGCNVPLTPQTLNITTNEATLYWVQPLGESDFESNWRQVGMTNWNVEISQDYFENISGLAANTTYEWKVRTICSIGGHSDWSSTVLFTTNDDSVGLTSEELDGVVIYPNPTTDILHLENCFGMSMKLMDNMGRLIHENLNMTNFVEIDVSQLAAGSYLIQILKDNRIKVSRVVKL